MNAKKVMVAVIILMAGACFPERAHGRVKRVVTATVKADQQPCPSVSGPTFRYVYVSGLREEMKGHVFRELRISGFTPTKRSRDALRIRIMMRRMGGKIICTAFMYDPEGCLVAQGDGKAENIFYYFRISGRFGQALKQEERYKAENTAVKTAIRKLIADYSGGSF